MVLNYKVLLRKENEGGYTVTYQPYRAVLHMVQRSKNRY